MTPSENRSTAWLSGYIPDLPTPFDPNGEIDLDAFSVLCERQIKAGVSALVVCETAGEASTLSSAERDILIRTAIDIARGRVRVIAGAGSNSTSQAIELTQHAEAAGADAVLSVVPYYNKPMQDGIYSHFRSIAESTRLPVILHDILTRTVRELGNSTLVRLAECKQFIGLRDGSGDVSRPLSLGPLLPPHFRLLTGDDTTTLAYVASGGDGCVSTVCNVIPGLCRIFPNGGEGWLPTSCELQRRLMPLHVCLSGIDPAALKYALSLRGFMHPTTRLPIVPLDEPAKAAINEAVAGIREHEFAPIDGQHRMMGPLGASDLCKPYIADAVSPSNSYTPSTIFADATLVPNSRK